MGGMTDEQSGGVVENRQVTVVIQERGLGSVNSKKMCFSVHLCVLKVPVIHCT
jgi:hypothetical protein